MAGQSVQQARAANAQTQQDQEGIEARVRAARAWFDTVVPSHQDPDQFIALCIGAHRRGRVIHPFWRR